MHLLFDDVLRPNKYLMGIFGMWPMPPNAGNTFKLLTLIKILVAFFSLIFLLLPHMYHVKINWGNIDVMADTGWIVFVLILIIFKFCYTIVHRRSFCTVHQHLREFWDVSHDEVERRSYEDLALIAKLATIVGLICGSINVISFLAAALIPLALNRYEGNDTLHHRVLPFDISYGFSTKETPRFELIFILQTFGMVYGILCAAGNDCTMLTIVLHVSGQFRFIGARFQTIGRNVRDSMYCNKGKARVEVTERISICLAHHRKVIRVAKMVNDLLSPMVLSQMLTSGIQICLTGYTVMEGGNSGADLIKFCTIVVSLMVQLFVWCWPGELLIQESNAVADSIWNEMPWFLLPAKQQRDLCFVILRAQKECHIATAFQIMSLQKLTEVLKAAGSYMALLRTMKEK